MGEHCKNKTDEELEAPPKDGIELGVEAADAHLREVPVGVDDLGPLHLTNILLVSCRYKQYLQYVLCTLTQEIPWISGHIVLIIGMLLHNVHEGA